MTWQLAILPKMLFFQIFTQLIISHSLNLVSDMNSSEKVSPHPLTKAALLCPMPVPWTSTLPMKIEITWSQKHWLYVLHCKSRTKYNIWHILSTQDISVSWNTGIFLKVPYSYVYKYTHTHTVYITRKYRDWVGQWNSKPKTVSLTFNFIPQCVLLLLLITK